jgi:DNA-binding NarL/FixJ family response regulator
VVLHGIVGLLSGEPNFKVVAACDDGVSALEAICKHAPEIALLDLRLPKMTGLDVLERVSNGKTRVVILTAFAEDHDVLAAVSRGAHGIVMKDSAASTLINCLRRVGAGFRCLPPQLVTKELRRLA